MENSKKLKRINNIKIITFWVICALIALFFKFSMVTPTYAYYVNSDGNLVSQNLFDIQSIAFNNDYGVTSVKNASGVTITNNTNSEWSRSIASVQLQNNQTYTITYNQTTPSYLYIFDNVGNIYRGDGQNSSNGLNQQFTFTTLSNVINFAFYAPVHSTNTITNIMINSGSTALLYEPFGTWISQENVNYTNSLLANMGLLQYLSYMQVYNSVTHQSIVINDVEEFTKEYLIDNHLISSSGVLNLNYFNTSALNPNYNPYQITFYFDDNIPLNLFNLAFSTYSSGTMTLIGNGTYIIQITSDKLSYDSNLINDTSLTYIEEMVISFDSADALSNINFNSYSIVNYNNGYNYGYNVGDSVGYQRGYNEGDSVGYQRGYNEGIQQDIESTGFKTLITTIISYPVNMVKESLNFEFMGIHVASIVLFIVSLGIVAFVIKRFKD